MCLDVHVHACAQKMHQCHMRSLDGTVLLSSMADMAQRQHCSDFLLILLFLPLSLSLSACLFLSVYPLRTFFPQRAQP